jgi:hypothetical protein
MLMRTDPFRELDRVAQQVLGTAARPAAMPIDAYRKGDEFVAMFDLPGLDRMREPLNEEVERVGGGCGRIEWRGSAREALERTETVSKWLHDQSPLTV